MNKRIIHFDILPNGKIIIALGDNTLVQLTLKSIHNLRKENSLTYIKLIAESTKISNSASAIIADYIGIQFASHRNILFQPKISALTESRDIHPLENKMPQIYK